MVPHSPMLYRRCTPIVDVQYHHESDTTAVEAVINAVSKAADVDPVSLPPLYDSIDPDLLTQLLSATGATSGTTVSFGLGEWNVFVRADGRIRVCDRTEQDETEPVFEATDTVST